MAGGPGVPPLQRHLSVVVCRGRPVCRPGRRAEVAVLREKGVCCTTQAQDKSVEAPAPEIEESGSDNGPAPLRRPPAPAATAYIPGVRPP